MASRSWEKAHSPYWSLHVEAWRQSRMDRAIYCRQHGLSVKTFGRWMKHLISKKEARKHAEYLLELRREERRQERRKKGKRRQKRRYAVSTDIRSRAIQAFWAIHVEAMNWNGMGVREYAASFQLSPTSPREWRDRFENTEVEDGAGGKDRVGCDGGEVSEEDSAVCELCLAVKMKSPPLSLTIRGRIFKDKEKLAVVLESEQPGMSIAEVCRRHDIVMSMVFRWRVQFGFAGKKAAKLVTVVLPEGSTGGSSTPATRRDRLRPPDEMMPLQLPDGRRVFAPEGRGPDAIQTAHSGSVTVL